MKHLGARLALAGAAVALVLGVSTGTAGAAFSLKGAGSTLIQPMLANVWIPDFQSANSGDSVSYAGGGSTAGCAAKKPPGARKSSAPDPS